MKYISLLPSTIITIGIERSCLIDVEKSIYCVVPNSLTHFFLDSKGFFYHDVYKGLDKDDRITFNEYISFLEKNNFIITSSRPLNFIYFDNHNFETSHNIQNAIIDSDGEERLFEKLDFFIHKPETIQLRLFFSPNYDFLSLLVDYLYINEFLNVEIIFNHNEQIEIQSYLDIYFRYNIISRFVIMGCKENISIVNLKIICLKEKLLDKNQCGKITERLFMPNIKTVSNSKNCNSCLYKKLSIDNTGDIKNCPSMSDSFGNISNTTIDEVLSIPNYKKHWNTTKDHIEVCKDCEFRHICTDCRAYIEEPENQYSKPLKCGYNPYTNEWKEWSTNPLKKRAIEFYGMQNLIKKDE